jgi:hypothetical protein
LGLEELAEAIMRLANSKTNYQAGPRVRRPLELPLEIWEKLDYMAHSTAQTTSNSITGSEEAAAIIEQYVAAKP